MSSISRMPTCGSKRKQPDADADDRGRNVVQEIRQPEHDRGGHQQRRLPLPGRQRAHLLQFLAQIFLAAFERDLFRRVEPQGQPPGGEQRDDAARQEGEEPLAPKHLDPADFSIKPRAVIDPAPAMIILSKMFAV